MDREYSLDFGWKFKIDRKKEESADSHRTVYLSVKAGSIMGPASKNFDDSGWESVDLPHDYVVSAPIEKEYGHADCHEKPDAWYRKCFSLDKSFQNKQVCICFEGIAMQAEIYLNGSLLKRSFSAYTEQNIDITERVYIGGKVNVIAVHAHASNDLAECWSYEGGGIYRHVKMYVKQLDCHIAHNGVFAASELISEDEKKWKIHYRIELENSSYADSTCYVTVKLLYNGKTVCAKKTKPLNIESMSSSTVELSNQVTNPKLWDIDNPELYRFEVSVFKDGAEVDREEGNTGFRYYRFDSQKGFFLNGRHLKLKGVSCHQDHAGVGVAVPDALQYDRIAKLKEMGANMYRSGHNNPAREILDCCDRLGILVIDENRHFEASEENLKHLEIVTKRDRNHPSVFLYCLMNEETLQNTEEGRKIFKRMKEHIKKFDSTRLFTGAMNGTIDGAGKEMDVCGINYGYGYLDNLHKNNPDICLLGSENNSQLSSRGCSKTDKTGAHRISELDDEFVPWGTTVKRNWAFARERDYLSGVTIWTGFDYHGETVLPWPSVVSQFGLMDLCGFPKGVYYFCKATYSDVPTIKILPHWNFSDGEEARIVVVSNCRQIELAVNGQSQGIIENDCCKQNEWHIHYSAGKLEAFGYNDGKKVAEDTVFTYSKAEKIVIEANRARFINSGDDSVILNCRAVDNGGHCNLEADNQLYFEIEGDATLLGVGNGDQNSHECECDCKRKLYCGMAQAIFRVNRNARSIKITVKGDGLTEAVFTPEIVSCDGRACIESVVNNYITSLEATASSETRIDPNMQVDVNDMNTFLPVEIEEDNFQLDYHSGWKLYRKFIKLPTTLGNSETERDYSLYLDDVKINKMNVYIDGREIYKIDIGHRYVTGSINCDFKGYEGQTVELRILLNTVISAPDGAGFRKSIRII